jgi:hypothetical protein
MNSAKAAISRIMTMNISRSIKNISEDMKNGININISSVIPKKAIIIAVTETNIHTLIKKKTKTKPIIIEE